MAKSHSSAVSFFVTVGLFFGGAALGTALGHWCAPNSSILAIASFLVFPLSMFLGFPAWLGSAFITLIFNWGGRRKPDKATPRGEFIPPGSWAFVPVTIGLFLPVALLAGFMAERMSFLATATLYLIVGGAYGIVMWRSARTGLLPFPEEA